MSGTIVRPKMARENATINPRSAIQSENIDGACPEGQEGQAIIAPPSMANGRPASASKTSRPTATNFIIGHKITFLSMVFAREGQVGSQARSIKRL